MCKVNIGSSAESVGKRGADFVILGIRGFILIALLYPALVAAFLGMRSQGEVESLGYNGIMYLEVFW